MGRKYRSLRTTSRREFMASIGALGLAGLAPFSGIVYAQGRKTALLIGLDIGDSITFDPARLAQYSSPMTVHNAYDTLVTMAPGDYINLKPNLATSWEYRPDGKAIRFKLLKGAKFASGNPVTAEDIKWSIERVINLKDQPAQYIAHVDKVEIVSPDTIDIVMKDPTQPLLERVKFLAIVGSHLDEFHMKRIGGLKQQNPTFGIKRISQVVRRGFFLPASPEPVRPRLHAAELMSEPTPAKRRNLVRPRFFERATPNQMWQTDSFTFRAGKTGRGRVKLVACWGVANTTNPNHPMTRQNDSERLNSVLQLITEPGIADLGEGIRLLVNAAMRREPPPL